MKSVAQLMYELGKYPANAKCFVYEGEVTGIIVVHPDTDKQSTIYCSEGNDTKYDVKIMKKPVDSNPD